MSLPPLDPNNESFSKTTEPYQKDKDDKVVSDANDLFKDVVGIAASIVALAAGIFENGVIGIIGCIVGIIVCILLIAKWKGKKLWKRKAIAIIILAIVIIRIVHIFFPGILSEPPGPTKTVSTNTPTPTTTPTSTPIPSLNPTETQVLEQYGYVTDNNVNFRVEPNGAKTLNLKKYELSKIYEVVPIDGVTWYRTSFGGVNGYIRGDYFHILSEDEYKSFIQTEEYQQAIRK